MHYHDETGEHEAYLHIDKGMIGALVALTIAIITQTGSFLWWASAMSTTVQNQEKRLNEIDTWRGNAVTRNEELVKLGVRMDELIDRVKMLEGRTRLPKGE
jgi:hypothetical protein